MCRCAPGAAWYTDRIVKILQSHVLNNAAREIVDIEFRFSQRFVWHVGSAIILAGTGQPLRPGGDIIVFIEPDAHFVRSCRTIKIVLHIVFTRPLQLYGPAGVFRDHHRLGNIIGRQPASKSATNACHFDSDIFPRQSGNRCCGARCTTWALRWRDNVATVLSHVRIAVLWFERRMRCERHLILTNDYRLRGGHRCTEIAVVQDKLPVTLK